MAALLSAVLMAAFGVAAVAAQPALGAAPAKAARSIPAGLAAAIHARFGPGPIGLGTAPLVSGISSDKAGWQATSASPSVTAQITSAAAVSAHLPGGSAVSLLPVAMISGHAVTRLALSHPALEDGRLTWQAGAVRVSDAVTGGGLEQRFTISHPAPGANTLTLSFSSAGQWRAIRSGSAIVPAATKAGNLAYAGLRTTDARGRVLPSRFETGHRGVRIVVAAASAVYPVTIDPTWTTTSLPTATLNNGDTSPGDSIGHSVALSSDGTTALVGAPEANGETGAVYVFHASAEGSWTSRSAPAATLSSSTGTTGQDFGASLALSPSGTTAVVGAPFFNNYKGAAYVFHVSSESAWSSTTRPAATLTSSTAVTLDELGASVAVSSDGTTAVAGAPGSAGAGYVFHAAAATAWSSTATPTEKLTASGSGSLGSSAALSADGTTAVIGADTSDSDHGAAFVFQATSESDWTSSPALVATLTSAAGPTDDQLGASVAITGSGTTIVAGAPGVTSSAGDAYVFHTASETSWGSTSTPDATLAVGGDTGYDNIGDSVAVSADGTTAFIGAAAVNGRTGVLYVFHTTSVATWATTSSLAATLSNGSGANGDLFGISVAVSSDGTLALIGAQGVDGPGAAYVLHSSSESAWASSDAPTAALDNGPSPSNDVFGSSVSLSDDGTTALVGAPTTFSKAAPGAAYIFHTAAEGSWLSTPVPTATLTNRAAATGALFGGTVALSGNGTTALIGATGVNNHAGAAYVFHAASESAWRSSATPLATLTVKSDGAYDELSNGLALSDDGTTALVSDEALGGYVGAAYIYHVTAAAKWVSQSTPKATLAHGVQGDRFGAAVALSSNGATALIGAWGENKQKGTAYIFRASSESTWASSTKPTATLTDTAPAVLDFGDSVGLSGDGTTALIGASATSNQTGAAYIYRAKSPASWASSAKPTATLTNSAGESLDEFGGVVALSADGMTALIAAPRYNTYTGAAYVFTVGSEAAWATTAHPAATITDIISSNDGSFADALGISADGSTALAGAWGVDGYTGTASIYSVTPTKTRPTPSLSGLTLAPHKLTLAGRKVGGKCVKATHANRHHAACRLALKLKVHLTASAAGTVTVTIEHEVAGRKVHGKCVPATHSNRKDATCTRTVKLPGHTTHAVARGKNTVALAHSGLAAGKYVVTVTLKAGGKTSKAKTAALTISG
jgi:hypothetical protein